MIFTNDNTVHSTEEVQKYINQIERKREYNRSYYHNKVKVKRETEKGELETLRERCFQLEKYIQQPKSDSLFNELKEQNKLLSDQVSNLNRQIVELNNDNAYLRQMLDTSRKRHHELMMLKMDEILPKI